MGRGGRFKGGCEVAGEAGQAVGESCWSLCGDVGLTSSDVASRVVCPRASFFFIAPPQVCSKPSSTS